jgi:hypothetical protein
MFEKVRLFLVLLLDILLIPQYLLILRYERVTSSV